MLEEKVLKTIKKYNLIHPNDTIIVGFSGGPDSTCLLYLLKNLQPDLEFNLVAAHLDHQWRPTSGEDTLFCQKIAQELDIPFFTKKASEIILKKLPCGKSQEEYGRLLRRQFFEEIAHKYKKSFIALGHQWDDQEETFFIRLIRGSSIAGLASMRPKKDNYIRPLLFCPKTEIIEYLNSKGIQYLKDYTNNFDIFLRNKIRKYILPTIKKVDPRFSVTFKTTLKNIQETDDFISRVVDSNYKEISSLKNGILYFDKSKFLSIDPFLYVPTLIKWLCDIKVRFTPTNSFFNEMMKFIKQSKSGKHKIHPDWTIVKEKNLLHILK